MERFTNIGSGWTMVAVRRFVVHIVEYRPFVGSSFIPTPKSIAKKNAIINVYNPNDEMCFVWAILSALYPVEQNQHVNSLYKYQPYLSTIDVLGLTFSVSVSKVSMFERNNPTISVNILCPCWKWKKEKEIIRRYVTKCSKRNCHINLLLLSLGDKFHYVYIKKMNIVFLHHIAYCLLIYSYFAAKHYVPFNNIQRITDATVDRRKKKLIAWCTEVS